MGPKKKTVSESNGKKRAPNFTLGEKEIIRNLMKSFHTVLECKKSDAMTNKEKAAKWEEFCAKFNSLSSVHHRTVDSLKYAWDNMKKETKKMFGKEKVETFKTGGGTRDPSATLSQEQEEILAILGPAGTGLNNTFDGDGSVEEIGFNAIDFGAITVPSNSVDGCTLNVTEPSWGSGDVCPRMLYNRKPDELRMADVQVDVSNVAASSSEEPSPDLRDLKKKTIAEEQEWAKLCKRRRPNSSGNKDQGTDAKDLITAKIQLAQETKKQLEEEGERKKQLEEERKKREEQESLRNEEMYQLEKKKKEMEAKIAELTYIKLLKELNMPLPEQDK